MASASILPISVEAAADLGGDLDLGRLHDARCRLRDDTGPEDQECQNAGGRGENG
jgi:hypothetical protein